MRHIPQAHETYRHFKGKRYEIVTLAEHSESAEMLVIYQAMYGDYKIYARPLSMFLEKVDKEKYPNVNQEYRFELETTMKEKIVPVIEEKMNIESEDDIETEGEVNLDPLVIEFLDADNYGEKLNILAALHHKITDDMINVMAIASDIEVQSGNLEDRYTQLKNCLLKLEKYESNRLR